MQERDLFVTASDRAGNERGVCSHEAARLKPGAGTVSCKLTDFRFAYSGHGRDGSAAACERAIMLAHGHVGGVP